MRIIASDRERTFIPSNKSLMVACPPGCVRGKVYFDSNAVAAWLRTRRVVPTAELFTARLVCGVRGEKPATFGLSGSWKRQSWRPAGHGRSARSMLDAKRV